MDEYWDRERSDTSWEIIYLRRAAAAKRHAARTAQFKDAYAVAQRHGMNHRAARKWATTHTIQRRTLAV